MYLPLNCCRLLGGSVALVLICHSPRFYRYHRYPDSTCDSTRPVESFAGHFHLGKLHRVDMSRGSNAYLSSDLHNGLQSR